MRRSPTAQVLQVGLALLLACGCETVVAQEVASGQEVDSATVGAGTLLDLWVDQQLAYRGLPGLAVAVIHDQQLVWSNAYGWADVETRRPMTTTTPFRIGSVTKLLTATAAMQLRDAGKLELDDPVARHLPWFAMGAGDDSPPITVRQLLTHTAGLPREAPFAYWTDHDFPSRDELISSLAEHQVVFPPETEYKYSNLGMALLGEVVAAASGESYAGYLDAHLFQPLQMAASTAAPSAAQQEQLAVGYMRRRPDGGRGIFDYYDTRALAPAANIVSTLEDLTRFAMLQFRDAPPSAAPVVAGSTLREMQRLHWLRPGWTSGRGLGFSVAQRDGKTVVSHGGWIAGNRTHLLLVPSEKIAVVAMVNADDGQPHVFSNEAYATFAPVLLGAASAEQTALGGEQASGGDASWQAYFGLYADPWEWQYRVLALDGELVLYDYNYPPADGARDGVTRLEPIGEHSFRMPDGEAVVFELDTSGSVQRIKRRSDYLFPVAATPQR